MSTDLFAAATRLAPETVAAAVPPACLRSVSAPAARRDGHAVVLDFGELIPRAPAVHLLPSLSLLADVPLGFRFELSARVRGAWTPWAATTTVGDAEFAVPPSTASPLAVEVDEVTSPAPVDAVRLRLRLRSEAIDTALAAPWLVTLSAFAGTPAPGDSRGVRRAALDVPAVSQLALGGVDALRICSPVSVAMVLGYFGATVDGLAFAAEAFHRPLDRYGVWPANVQAAARHGVAGYLLRFPSWDAAAWCLDHGLPIVASVRYGAGELSGAATEATTGHLIVIAGYEDGWALVNDPVAPDGATVRRRYRLDELTRVWLTRAGVGYVFFRPSTPPSGRSPRP